MLSEVVTRYCPQCLFEAPSQSALDNFNTCQRNCVSCPRCDSNAIPRHSDGGYLVSCSLQCGWSAHIASKPLASFADLSQKDAFSQLYKAFTTGDELASPPSRDESPKPVSLRAKWARKCSACRTMLVMPNPSPSKLDFSVLSPLNNVMPRIEDRGNEVVVFNSASNPVEVEMCSEIHMLGPLQPRNSTKELLQGVPAEWIKRETTESRQVFMEKSRYDDFAVFRPALSRFKVKTNPEANQPREMWVSLSSSSEADSPFRGDEDELEGSLTEDDWKPGRAESFD